MRRTISAVAATVALIAGLAAPAHATTIDPLGLSSLDGAQLLRPTQSEGEDEEVLDATVAVRITPTVFSVDTKTGRALSGATYNVQRNDLLTGEDGASVGPYRGNIDGTWLWREIEFQSSGDGLIDGEPADEFVLTGVTPPPGYLPLTEPVTITATVDGWEAAGPVEEIAPNVFVINYQPGEASDPTGATEEDPIRLGRNHGPTFVAVDSATGQPIAGSYWGGESCTRFGNEPDWTCISLDDYRLHMDVDGSYIVDNIDLEYNQPHEFRLENRMAPPGCSLVEEPVYWEQDADGVTVYGGGVYQYGDTVESEGDDPNRRTLLAIPFDCSTPTPVCSAGDRPVHEVETDSRYDGGDTAFRLGPSVVRTDAAGRIVSGSVFEVNVYAELEDGSWTHIAQDQLIDMEANGTFYTRDVPLRSGNYMVEAREVRSAIGTTLREQTYVFVGSAAGESNDWEAFEGATLVFDESTGDLKINTDEVVLDPQQQTLYRVNESDFAIGEPLDCPVSGGSSGSSLWPLLLLPPALIGSSIAASSLLPGAPELDSSAHPEQAPAPQAPAQTTIAPEPAPEKAQPQVQPAEERQLARTGADVAVLLALAVALIVVGGFVVRLRRV
ncbi:MAG: hypothetical protein Q4G50_08615 [Corynebacterium sp.]|uniref:hypothetical protein n=1 Tax=Corynebacterium sp. TaxID=1720 RepID=UPI0026E10EB9|nr:hypothetical protein [Corynebacterium sp.]MDO5670051.1 hypothetical protein [Corynebacterium sp.]